MRFWFAVTTTGVILAYLFYLPLPDGITQPMFLRITYAQRQILKLVTMGSVALGIKNPIEASRDNIDYELSLLEWGCDEEPSITHTDTTFDGVKVRVYEPVEKSTELLPGMVYIHGGGWTISTVDTYHHQTRHMAARLGIVLVSIDYRLAPENPFPAALDDSIKAIVWFLQHAKDYGVDATRIAVVGDSAGGNLAAASSALLTFEDKYLKMGLPKLKFQGLIYPALQAIDFLTPSYQQSDIFSLSKEAMTNFWSWYLLGDLRYAEAMKTNNHTCPQMKAKYSFDYSVIPEKFRKKPYEPPKSMDFGDVEICEKIGPTLLNPDFAPLMRADLKGLPPAYILTVEFDVLRDDGILYAKKLEQANVPVTWKHYDTGFHCIFSISAGLIALEVGKECMDDFLQFSRASL